MATCSQVIARTLKALGIKRIFGVPGGEILDFIEACRQDGIEFIMVRHEAVAAFMADVAGQITGIPGVCLSTVGPGATNLVSGVANAYLDRSPVLVFSAQLSTSAQPYANHQFIPLEKLFDPITKKVFTFSGQNSRGMVLEGFQIATTGPQGPVYFCLPSDMARKDETPSREEIAPELKKGLPNAIDGTLISQAIEEIQKAKKPLVILGIGVDPRKDTETVRRFIKKNKLPVMATPKAKGIFPDSDPLYLATASGMMADHLAVDMIMKSDLVIGIGFDPVESDKIWHNDVHLLSINNYSIGHRSYLPYLEVIGDVKMILDLFMNEDFSHHWIEDDLKDFKERLRTKLTPSTKPMDKAFSPYEIILKARKALSADTIVTSDVGAHKLLLGQAWVSYHPLTFFMSNGLSSMGYGFPAAMAAKLSKPEAQVVCMTGDGGFSMMLQDLETAVRLSLPVVTLVLCDNSLSLIEVVQSRRSYPRYGVNFNKVQFASVAEDFGARGIRLQSLEELPEIFSTGFNSSKPTVVEIPVDNKEYHEQL